MTRVDLRRTDNALAFEASDTQGHRVQMDGSPEIGGHNAGVRPMQQLLMALGGCSGIDIVSILTKQKQQIRRFDISVEGERDGNKGASLWKEVRVHFQLAGDIDAEKAQRACALSVDTYCSVAATLRAAGCQISWRVSLDPVSP